LNGTLLAQCSVCRFDLNLVVPSVPILLHPLAFTSVHSYCLPNGTFFLYVLSSCAVLLRSLTDYLDHRKANDDATALCFVPRRSKLLRLLLNSLWFSTNCTKLTWKFAEIKGMGEFISRIFKYVSGT